MRIPSIMYVFVLIAALLLPGAATTAQEPIGRAAAPLNRSDFIGMVVRDPFYEWNSNPAWPNDTNRTFLDRMGKTLAESGVKWVRLEFHLTGNVEEDLKKHDYFINEVAPRHGFKVLALLGFDLLRGRSEKDLNSTSVFSDPRYGGGVNDYMKLWLDRALTISDRYGTKIAAYEILNEENRLPPDGSAIEPTVVGRLITKFYRLCHGLGTLNGEVHPCGQSDILLGGLHPRGTTSSDPNKDWTDAEYLAAIYSDKGSFAGFKDTYLRYPVDGIAYHPYPEEIRLSPNYTRQIHVDNGIARIHKVIQQYDAGRKIWITEIGYNVAFSGNKASELGPFMRDIYTSLAKLDYIANVFWFKYEDFAPASGSNAQKWGIVRIPFSADTNRPDGVRYQSDGLASEMRASFTVLRELAGVPAYPTQVYAPFLTR